MQTSCRNSGFQSTLLQEERLDHYRLRKCDNYFNPRSYKRSDLNLFRISGGRLYFNPRSYKRSDHLSLSQAVLSAYFNPRSYKRSDSGSSVCNSISSDFNPRSYKRSDSPTCPSSISLIISIHAPTRGATFPLFQLIYIHKFQSTLLQEERRVKLYVVITQFNFNPRSYKRSDFIHGLFGK